MKIRSKLILMLAIPVIALAVIAFAGFRDQSAKAEDNERAGEIASAIIGLEEVALSTAEERLTLAQFSLPEDVTIMSAELAETLDMAITETDARLADAHQAAQPLGDSFIAEVERVESAILSARSNQDLPEYTEALGVIDEIVRSKPLTGFSPDAVRAVDAIQTARQIAGTHEATWFDFFSLTPEQVTPQTVAEVVGGFERVDLAAQATAQDALTNGIAFNREPATSSAFTQLSQLRALAEEDMYNATPDDLAVGDVLPSLLDNRVEWNASVATATSFVEQDIGVENSEINDRRSLFTLLAVLGTLTVFTLMFVIGRSILGPLGRLMEHADKTTNERLPFAVAQLRTLGAGDEPPAIREIPRETNDEVGSLVDAFNDIQNTAVNIATDQARSRRNVAEMFVSLGRRNQQLNHRMLNLISDLERDEQDSETLAGLYQLDHLATRMRRNAESLLVLAGNRSPRQWSRPVDMEDVVRQSLSEVELFERVEVGDLPELAMQGNVVTDVTHLLAELLDNATQFSEPSTTVQISAQETLEGVEIEIFDEGFGIGDKDLVELNERITNPPALDEAPSRLLGLFVVGRLAQQHHIDVVLQSQPGVGTVATIAIPSKLFAEVERAEIEPPSALSGALSSEADGLDALADIAVENDVLEASPEDIAGSVSTEAEAPGLDFTPLAGPNNDPVVPVDAPVAAALTEAPTEAPPMEFTVLPGIDEDPVAVEAEVPVAAAPEIEFGSPSTEFATPVVEAPLTEADGASVEAAPAPAAWDPAAIHENQLADASMPTMQEVEAAMPAFPGVTIDPPEAVAESIPDAPAITPFDQITAFQQATSTPVSEIGAPGELFDAPAVSDNVDETTAPVVQFPVDEPAAGAAFPALEPPEVTEFSVASESIETAEAPSVAEFSVAPENPMEPSSGLPAPPVIQGPGDTGTPDQPEVAVQPALPTAPPELPAAAQPQHAAQSASDSFGGLPTRSPQATLDGVDETPTVMPLAGVADDGDKPSNPAAFAAFASGVNRGLESVQGTPGPKHSTEGDTND